MECLELMESDADDHLADMAGKGGFPEAGRVEDGAPPDGPRRPAEDELEVLEPAQRGAEHVQLGPVTPDAAS